MNFLFIKLIFEFEIFKFLTKNDTEFDLIIIKHLIQNSLLLVEMDYKDFKDGLTSLSCMIFIFSLTFLMGAIILQYQTQLTTPDKDFIVILCAINIIFSLYYLAEAVRLDKVFKLEDKHVFKFGKRIVMLDQVIPIPNKRKNIKHQGQKRRNGTVPGAGK